jgi:hypothetical protein
LQHDHHKFSNTLEAFISMKLIFLFFLFVISSIAAAQPANAPASPPEVRFFEPLSLPGQERPIKAPRKPLVSAKNKYYLILAIILLAVLGLTIFLCVQVASIWMRLLIVLLALSGSAFVSYGLLFAAGITATPDDSTQGIFRSSMLNLAKQLGLPMEVSPVVVEDDGGRFGILLGEQALVLADFGENRGLLTPYAHLDSVVSYEGTRSNLPALPAAAADRWIIETQAAQAAADTAQLQQIEWYFRDLNPSAVVVRYAIPDYFFPEVGSIASLCKQWQSRAQ